MSTTSYSNDKLDTFSMPSIADINKFREKQMVISLKLRMIQNGFVEVILLYTKHN